MIKETQYVLTSEDGRFVSQQMHTPVLVVAKAASYTFTEQRANELKPAYEAFLGVKLTVTPFGPPIDYSFMRPSS